MKKFYKAALLAALGLASVSAAQANFTVNDLYLGFTQSSATSDLVLDLGQASSLFGQTSVVDLSSYIGNATTFNTTFNTLFDNTASGVDMAVMGGNTTFGAKGVFATQVRIGGPGDPTVAGSSISATHSTTQMSGGAAAVSGIMSSVIGGLPSVGTFELDSTKSYTLAESVSGLTSSFPGKTGVVPNGTIDNTGIIYEDFYAATQAAGSAGAYTYEGYLTFNYNSDTLNFTPAAVPEPTTYTLLACSGLFVVLLRNQFRRKQA